MREKNSNNEKNQLQIHRWIRQGMPFHARVLVWLNFEFFAIEMGLCINPKTAKKKISTLNIANGLKYQIFSMGLKCHPW